MGESQLAAQRATIFARLGPASMTSRKRAVCIAMTKGRSTLEAAAMIATESAPPGLVAEAWKMRAACIERVVWK